MGVLPVSEIEFSKDEKEIIVGKIQLYFRENLEREIGRFDAEFLLRFFSQEVGAYFYNRGLYDAQAHIESKLESFAEGLSEAIYEIEKPTELVR